MILIFGAAAIGGVASVDSGLEHLVQERIDVRTGVKYYSKTEFGQWFLYVSNIVGNRWFLYDRSANGDSSVPSLNVGQTILLIASLNM